MRISENELRRVIRSVIKESIAPNNQLANDKVITILKDFITSLDQAYDNDTLDDAFDGFYGHKTSDLFIGVNSMLTKVSDEFDSLCNPSVRGYFATQSPLGRYLLDIKMKIHYDMDLKGPIHQNILLIKHLVEKAIHQIEDGSLSIV